MIASLCEHAGSAGLICGGFYVATLAAVIAPPVVGLVGIAGALWMYGKRNKQPS